MKPEKEIEGLYNHVLSVLIQEIRKENNLTQRELAEIMNKSEITIRNYEKERLKVTFEVLFFLIHYFTLPPFYLHEFFIYKLREMEKEKKCTISEDEALQIIALLYENLKKIYNTNILGIEELEKEKNSLKLSKKNPVHVCDLRKNSLKIQRSLLLKHLNRYIITFYEVEYINKLEFKKFSKIFNKCFFDKLTKKIFYYINTILEYEFEENELNNIKEIKKPHENPVFKFLNKY